MAIQQLDLGAVYNTLAQKRSQDLQAQQVGQQGQMNALQMARYQRENDDYDRKQSALSAFNDPNSTPEQKQSALSTAFPELAAQAMYTPRGETQVVVPSGGAVFDRRNGTWAYPEQSPLDGETVPVSSPQTAPRPTLAPGGHGPVPMPVERQPLGVQMASSESGGRPGIVNKQGYSGKYQFGEAAASAAGFYEPDDNPNDNKWNGRFKGLNGVNSYQDFLGNEAAQDQAFSMHQTHLDAEIEGRGLGKYIGQTVGGVPVTRDALAGMMHIGGPAGTQKFLESGGKYNPGDSNGTRISDYGKKFAGEQGGAPAASQVDQHVIQVLGPELAGKVFAAEKANPNALLTDVMPPEWVQQHPEAKGVTIAQRRQQIESRFADSAPQAPQPAGDEGFSRVRNMKALGLSDAPTGMMWVGRRRPDGSIETKVAPIPGTEAGDAFGKGEDAHAYRIYKRLSAKQASGEPLSDDDQLDLDFAVRQLNQSKVAVGADGLVREIKPAPLPQRGGNKQPQSTASTVTEISPSNPKPTNDQNLNAGFANRLNSANSTFDQLESGGYEVPGLKDRIADSVPLIGNYVTSDNFQKMEQAQREFVTAQLRRESGAAISQGEFESAKQLYFPQPGNSAEVIAQKRASRELAVANMAQSSGPAPLSFKPKPAAKSDETKPKILRFDAQGNLIQ